MNTKITDNKYSALKSKLRELFELDKADLDFGIYRIMAARNQEVTEFLDRQLKDVVRETLAEHGAGAIDTVQTELDKAVEQAQQLGADPDTLPKVQALKAQLETAGGASATELEADIYNHLLAFFSRYYDEGDFISQRRYKGDTYAIPYSGEEVMLHWANKDQYYIKSGEWHKDYRFKISGTGISPVSRTVRVRLLQATQETNNNKEADGANRRFILCADNPVDTTNPNELILHFEFRVPTAEEKQIVSDSEATRIFGGKYDKDSGRTKGDDREQFAAYAEKNALDAMTDEWKLLLSQPGPTDAKPYRTILGKHLGDFTARNEFDYFIHKDLGRFLRRELDFYIKNEVVRLDDLEKLDEGHLARVQGRIKAVRRVAGRIIEFLAAIENFQKKLWLKKKLVLNTNWLVTIDRIPAKLRDIAADNKEQWTEWETLGFKLVSEDTHKDDLFETAKWGTREYLETHDKLVVDTRFFDAEFKSELLASEEVLSGAETIEDALTGVLIHGENFQALGLLQARYREQIKCVYIDPPYNTSASEIVYKNSYKHSSWLSLLDSRIALSKLLLINNGISCYTIDDFEFYHLRQLLCNHYAPEYLLGTSPIRNNPSGRSTAKGFSVAHEYAIYCGNSELSNIGRLPRNEIQQSRYDEVDELGNFEWVNFRKHGGTKDESPKMFYPFYASASTFRIPLMEWNELKKEWLILDSPKRNEETIYPIDDSGQERRWKWGIERVKANLKEFKIDRDRTGKIAIYVKTRVNDEGVLPLTWWDKKEYSSTAYGTNYLKDIFKTLHTFSYPKSIYAVMDCLRVTGATDVNSTALDYFAGSGTTGHAVINLNREDNGNRRFILVEMGTYFNTVLKPRIAKVIYSPDWKDGKAQTHDKGVSALVKYFAVESYEDALNNLPAPEGELLRDLDDVGRAALITYALDLELGPHLLNLDAFRDPWGYSINAQPAGDDEIRPHSVDLVETFNYLLGLKVSVYGPVERYTADFERAKHEDNKGRLKVKGRLHRAAEGQFVFQRVEGVLNDGQDTRVLVIWRKLTDDPEQDAAVLDAWMERHREDTKQRSDYRDYHQIYVNGSVTLEQPTQEIRTVFPIEQTFKDRMFADEEGEV